MMYVLETTRPVSVEEAQQLGQTLKHYAIDVVGLQVWHVWPDGSRHRDNPLAKTISDTAGSVGGGALTGSAIAPVAVPLIGLLPWFPPLWAILAGMLGSVKTLYKLNRKVADPRADHSEVLFALGNVSEKRARWVEDLIGAFCALHEWRFRNPRFPAAAANGARRGRMPLAWATRARQETKSKPGRVATWLKEH